MSSPVVRIASVVLAKHATTRVANMQQPLVFVLMQCRFLRTDPYNRSCRMSVDRIEQTKNKARPVAPTAYLGVGFGNLVENAGRPLDVRSGGLGCLACRGW